MANSTTETNNDLNQDIQDYKQDIEDKDHLLKSLFFYLIKPIAEPKIIKKFFLLKIWDIIRIWALSLVFLFISSMIIGIVINYLTPDVENNMGADFAELLTKGDGVWQMFLNYSILIFITVILPPLLEETMFRLPQRYSPFSISFSLAVIIFFLFNLILGLLNQNDLLSESFISLIKANPYLYYSIWLIIGLLIAIGLGFILKKFANQAKIKRFYQKYFFLIFYSTTLLFGLAHVLNWENIADVWYLTPLLVIPQIIIGSFLGFIRMKFGFIYAMLYHGLHNGMLVFPFLIIPSLISKDYLQLISHENPEQFLEKLENPDGSILLIILFFIIFFLSILLIFLASAFHFIFDFFNKRKN
jgi:hypothetical protein